MLLNQESTIYIVVNIHESSHSISREQKFIAKTSFNGACVYQALTSMPWIHINGLPFFLQLYSFYVYKKQNLFVDVAQPASAC